MNNLEYPELPERLAAALRLQGRDFYDRPDFVPSRRLPDGKSKWDVVKSFKAARKSLGLTSALTQYLEYLVGRTEDQDWRPGSCPIVFSPVASAVAFFDVDARQINTYERDLAALGLLTRHDSGNRRRYEQRYKDGSLRYAYGADLSPLIERYEEIVKMVEADRQELVLRGTQIKAVKAWRRVLKDGLRKARALSIRTKVVAEASGLVESLPKTFPTKWTSIEFCALAMKLEDLCIALKAELKPYSQEKTSDQTEENFRHHNTNNTTLFHYGNCYGASPQKRTSPDRDEITLEAEPAIAGGIEKEKSRCTSNPDSPPGAEARPHAAGGGSTGIEHIRLDQVLDVSSLLMRQMIYEEAEQGGVNWAVLDRAAAQAAAFLGVSKLPWHDLRTEIGSTAAAVCIVITERHISDPQKPFNNPGGFVRGLLDRARNGKLHLHKSIFGLIKCDNSEKPGGLT
ncbi:MAG: hypothetical protein K5905_01560 [Roseibium sp.]|uniref:replication initiation protein RepC n=1 Tax=Roseibium sp. TaxID=1936156 RepID=UPI002615DE82|nr:replication initiation protein RepC [Roseibium sp.]MCV0424137.1 hypothetical protein [Roseibium sp.]